MKKQIAAVLLVLAAVLISGCTDDMSADHSRKLETIKIKNIEN